MPDFNLQLSLWQFELLLFECGARVLRLILYDRLRLLSCMHNILVAVDTLVRHRHESLIADLDETVACGIQDDFMLLANRLVLSYFFPINVDDHWLLWLRGLINATELLSRKIRLLLTGGDLTVIVLRRLGIFVWLELFQCLSFLAYSVDYAVLLGAVRNQSIQQTFIFFVRLADREATIARLVAWMALVVQVLLNFVNFAQERCFYR